MTARLGVKPRSRNGVAGAGKGRKRERSLFEIMEEIERKESSDHLGDREPSGTAVQGAKAASAEAAAAEASKQQKRANAEAEKRAAQEKVTVSLLTAERINRLMREHSDDCALTVVNLPLKTRMQPEHFVDYVSVLTKGIDRMLLVRGSGKEVVTSYA